MPHHPCGAHRPKGNFECRLGFFFYKVLVENCITTSLRAELRNDDEKATKCSQRLDRYSKKLAEIGVNLRRSGAYSCSWKCFMLAAACARDEKKTAKFLFNAWVDMEKKMCGSSFDERCDFKKHIRWHLSDSGRNLLYSYMREYRREKYLNLHREAL